jgi:hypothetical protein
MYRTVAGIQAESDGPGYGHITFGPQPGGGLTHASATYQSVRGPVRSAWRLDDDGKMSLDVTAPGNSTATVRIPAPSRWAVTEGGKAAEDADSVRFVRMDDGVAVFEIGSGTYTFAVDPVRGDIGDAVALVTDLDALVDRLAAEGGIDKGAQAHLSVQVDKLAREVAAAQRSYVDGRRDKAADDVHRALATAADISRWVTAESQRPGPRTSVTPAAAQQLNAVLADVIAHLSSASADLVGAVATLDVPTGDQLPGDTLRATVTVANGGDRTLTDITSALTAPQGWTITRVGPAPSTAPRGKGVQHTYDVVVPVGQQPGTSAITGTASYRHQGGTATLPLSASVVVAPAVEIGAVTAEPSAVEPGGSTEVRTVLRNRSARAVSGMLSTTVPSGWKVDDASAAFTLAAGEERTLTGRLTAPLAVTEGAAEVTVATGGTAAEKAVVPVNVRFTNPPPDAYDHVDVGAASSEQAHGLTASQHSGTNVEAGLTRRYTNVSFPGGWFEMNLEVEPGEPFVLRAVETYDQAQLKDYDVLVDGEVVHHRAYQRTVGGLGSLSYQFVVDAPEATADGTVRVRFLDVGDGYDPSIADVWTSPVPASGST